MLRTPKTFARLALALATGLAAPLAAAQAEGALPPAQSVGGVKYVPGGIGKEESDAMLGESKRYPLAMVFSAGKDNHYLADVDIRVRDAAGETVLMTTIEGPIVLMDLPAGKYQVDAEYKNRKLTRRIEVSAKRAKRVDFHWAAGE